MTVSDLFARHPSTEREEVDITAELAELLNIPAGQRETKVWEVKVEARRRGVYIVARNCHPSRPQHYNPFMPARYFMRLRPGGAASE